MTFDVSDSAISFITRITLHHQGVTANEEITLHSNCVLADASLHGGLRIERKRPLVLDSRKHIGTTHERLNLMAVAAVLSHPALAPKPLLPIVRAR